MKIDKLPLDGEWEKVFGRPDLWERWFISGDSASGKSTFVMLLAKKLCEYGKVLYECYEERLNGSFQDRTARLRMEEVDGRFQAVKGEPIEELAARLAKPKSPPFVIIDSVQYLNTRRFDRLKALLLDRFPRKAFFFVSQSYKGTPKGRLADDIKYDCGVKVNTQGYRAYCQGRYIDDAAAYYTIWEEGAAKYYLNE